MRKPFRVSGPGEPPPGFKTAHNSKTEWWAYWGLWRATNSRGNPRNPPYIGVPGVWEYQSPYEGGRITGGQVIDFVYLGIGSRFGGVAIRITTERYHVLTDYEKQAMDRILQARLGRFFRVVDVFEQDIINDPSGQAAVREMYRAISGRQSRHPVRSGTAR